jgi:PST family polysaccharide transporter
MAMALTLTALFDVFSDLGLSWVTVQEPDLNRAHVDNLFWIGGAGGVVLWGMCAVAGPILNSFYGRTDLAPIAVVCGAGFLLSSLAVQPTSLLRRQLHVSEIAKAEVLSQVVAAFVGIAIALLGGRYWSLVAMSLGKQLAYLGLILWSARYWPGLPYGLSSMKRFLRFGAFLSGNGILVYLARNLDNILIGKYWGADQLAYYSRAYFLMLLPGSIATGVLTGVVVPALSAVAQDRERMGVAFRRALRAVAALAFPIAIGLCVAAPEFVHMLYGPKWIAVVPLLRWLALASISQPIYMTVSWIFISVGKSKEMFLWSLTQAVVLATAFMVAVHWGATGVAIAYGVVATCGVALPGLYFAHRAAELPFIQSVRTLRRPLFASFAMGAAACLAGAFLGCAGAVWQIELAGKVLTCCLVYLVAFGPIHLMESLTARSISEMHRKELSWTSMMLYFRRILS